MLINMALDDYINETASGSPAPGGGSVSSLTAALGSALASMVGEITVKKDIDDQKKAKMQGMIKICHDLIKDFKEGVDADTEVFNKVMAAYKLPKITDDEKKSRSAAIQAALKDATELPYNTAVLCIDLMNMAVDMLREGNVNAASDASVAGFLGYAALNGALFNVRININSIKDKEFVEEMRGRIESLSLESEKLLEKIKSMSAEIIG